MNNFIPKEVMEKLLSLRKKYFPDEQNTLESLYSIYNKYLKRRRDAILDSLIASANLSINIFDSDSDPLALEAIKMTNPNFDPTAFDNYSDEQLTGIINSAKGKYFELLVAEKLNNGEQVGDLILPDGYHAELAESLTQPGWDLSIVDNSGDIADHLQLKATESLSYISEALHKYPDIKILTADEVAEKFPDGYTMVIDSDIPNRDMVSTVEDSLNSEDPGFIEKFGDGFHPLMPLSIIAAMEGYKVFTKKQTTDKAIKNGSERFGRSLFSTTLGSLVFALGGGILSIPVAFTAGLYYRRLTNMRKVSETMKENITRIKSILKYQKANRRNTNGIL